MAAMQQDQSTGTARLTIERNPDLEDLPALAAQLSALMAGATRVELSVAAEEVSLAFLQLLCAAHRSAAARGRELQVGWQNRGAAGLLREAGFIRHVSCPRSTDGSCLWLEEHWR